MQNGRKLCGFAVLFAAVVGWSGCVILPVPAKTRIEGAGGPTKLDVKGFRAGETKKAEVETRLETLKVPIESRDLVWARFSKSNMATVWAVGSYGGGAAGGERNWGIHNLFVTFNEDGTMKESHEVSDEDLNAALREYLRRGSIGPFEFAQEITLNTIHVHRGNNRADVKLVLKSNSIDIQERWSEKHSFHVDPKQVREFHIAYEGSKPDAGMTVERLRFLDANAKERVMRLTIRAEDIPVLVAWMAQVQDLHAPDATKK